MGILIRGMEMPQKCGQCKFYHAEYPMYCMAVKGYRTVGAPYGMPRPDWCPLTEVKEPHGRLIDADELANKTFYSTTSAPYITYKTFCNAPTVIEAEGEKSGR